MRFTILNLRFTIIALGSLLFSCGDDDTTIPTAEERTNTVINNLKSELIAPANGWRLNYHPTSDAGTYFMLLDFQENGSVVVETDLSANGGEFYRDTLEYRIESSLGINLIFATYGAFHYLFELDQTNFGAEFEFIYQEKNEENLIFKSASDGSNPTEIVLEPASAGDENEFSREIAKNMEAFATLTPQIFGSVPPIQQVIFEDRNASLFWAIDLNKRNIFIDFAAEGTNLTDIASNASYDVIGETIGFAFQNGKLVLNTPVQFNVNGIITLSEITLTDFNMTGPTLCALGGDNTARYEGSIPAYGDITLLSGYISSTGAGFVAGNVFDVNSFFLFDGEGNSLSDEGGLLAENFPTASGFVFIYDADLVNDEIPGKSVGLILADGSLYLREIASAKTDINKVSITFSDNFYFSTPPPLGAEEALTLLTDKLFEGGEVYAYTASSLGTGVYRLFNPCNGYEIFLVQ